MKGFFSTFRFVMAVLLLQVSQAEIQFPNSIRKKPAAWKPCLKMSTQAHNSDTVSQSK